LNTENPFAVYSPEQQTPKDFKEIFVKEYTWVNALETPKDFIIYGSRGSGKSMLLTFLELSHQLCYFNDKLEDFLSNQRVHKYLGIMVQVTNEELSTSRYELLSENQCGKKGLIQELCMNDLIMTILFRTLRTTVETNAIREYIDNLDNTTIAEFCEKGIERLDRNHFHKMCFKENEKNSTKILALSNEFLKERTEIQYYANDVFQIRNPIYKANFASFNYLNDFLVSLKELLKLPEYSFYILIDNGDEARANMQQCIDELISKRKHENICLKVALKKGANWDLQKIQTPHDFSPIDIDELYSTRGGVYNGRIREIANKRLGVAKINVCIEDFLPENLTEKKILKLIQNELREEYKKEYVEVYGTTPIALRPTESDYVNNKINKCAPAILFRRLKKTAKSYAGFTNITHLSSGIIRQFLDLCSYMFDEESKGLSEGKQVEIIGLKTQRVVIDRYANEMMDDLKKKYTYLEQDGFSKELAVQYRYLFNLIETLGIYYRKRLLDPKFVEPRVFTFTLKDPGKNRLVDTVLKLGTDENYFQSYWYSSKTGLGKYPGYAFNRRLCPRYRIDHTSFRGRIELTTADLKKAMENMDLPKDVREKEEETRLDSYL
jgi:hypothetical protein